MSYQTRRSFLKQTAAAGASALAGMHLARAVPAADRPAGLKYAICNETFVDWPHEKACRFAAECGYEALEIAPFTFNTDVTRITANERKSLRATAEKAGVPIVALHWLLAKTAGLHLTSPEKAVRRNTAEYLTALGDFCGDLGGSVMVFGSPRQRDLLPGVDMEQGLAFATEVLQATMPALKKRNVTLALEPLGPNDTNFLNTGDEAVALARRVDHPNCKLLLDCKAMFTEPAPIPQIIRKHHEWMVHFHANDSNLRGPGMGDLDFVPIFEALCDVNYRGWVSVEVFDYEPGVEALARESIEYMRKVEARVFK
ncbi:MAG: sugar phosphate isomerase/epimerase family protein [Thermoguttaceae bacterium]|jgi:sugar phosphate isomerase/epimerase|nr:sugar phosphate isomerase/epimerase family protein [Thermoguttaceae bacterium]